MERLIIAFIIGISTVGCQNETPVNLSDFEGDWKSVEGEMVNHLSFQPDENHWRMHSYLIDHDDTLFSENYRITGDSANSYIEFPNGMKVNFEKRNEREIRFGNGSEIFVLKLDKAETLSITLTNSQHEPYTLYYHRME